jgi:hypothetical protein
VISLSRSLPLCRSVALTRSLQACRGVAGDEFGGVYRKGERVAGKARRVWRQETGGKRMGRLFRWRRRRTSAASSVPTTTVFTRHQYFSHNKSATNNHLVIFFSQNKSASAISHQPNEHAAHLYSWRFIRSETFAWTSPPQNQECEDSWIHIFKEPG